MVRPCPGWAAAGGQTGCSAAWLARHVRDVEVPGSNPGSPTPVSGSTMAIVSEPSCPARNQPGGPGGRLECGEPRRRGRFGPRLLFYQWCLLSSVVFLPPVVPPDSDGHGRRQDGVV